MSSLLRLPATLLDAPLLRLRPLHRSCSSHASTAAATRPPKLRFAPSPTGYLHLGGLRTALFNHLLARKLGGSWVLRVEDTDQTRYVEGAVESLLRTLSWAGLEFDEGPGRDAGNGPYYQSQRREIYDKYLQTLIDQKRAYHCFCSSTRLAAIRKELQKAGDNSTYDRHCLDLTTEEVQKRLANGEKSVVRFKSSDEGLTQHDLVYSPIHYPSMPVEDFVLRKSDGLPTYHFANVVDDWEMGITHVLRGEEWLPSTPKHLSLYRALELPPPAFAHMPLLVNKDGSKLSKRQGDVAVEDYIAKGYEPEALLNFVALLGWSPQSSAAVAGEGTGEDGPPAPAVAEEGQDVEEKDTDVLSMDEMIEQFSLPSINKNRATLSLDKLLFLNRAHLQRKLAPGADASKRQDLSDRAVAVVQRELGECEKGTTDSAYVGRVLEALKERIHTIHDVPNLGPAFFQPPDLSSKAALSMYKSSKPSVYPSSLQASLEVIQALPSLAFDPTTAVSGTAHDLVLDSLNELVRTRGKGPKEVMSPLRWAVTGCKVGAGLPATIAVIGRDRTIERVQTALRWSEERGH